MYSLGIKMQTRTHLVTGDLLILSGSSVTLKKKTNAHVSNRWVHAVPQMLTLNHPSYLEWRR